MAEGATPRHLDHAGQLPGLTALRAPLAWWVAIYHLSLPGGWLDADRLWWPLRELMHCCLSVDILFVFSGYILARIYWDLDRSRWSRFARARAARLLPLHLLALLLSLPFIVISGVYAPGLLPLVFTVCALGLQAWVPPWALAINPPAWAISAEIAFCAAFPFLQPWIRRLQSQRTCLWLLAGCWVLAVLPAWALAQSDPVFAGMHLHDGWRTEGTVAHVVKYLPLMRLPEFVFGMLLCAWHRQRSWAADGRLLVPLALTVILSGIIVAGGSLPYTLAHNGLFMPAIAALIVGLCDRRWADGWMANPGVLLLGRSSFAFFILHTPGLMIANSLVKRIPVLAGLPPWMLGVGALVLIQAVAIAILLWIEEPLRRRLRPPRAAAQGVT